MITVSDHRCDTFSLRHTILTTLGNSRSMIASSRHPSLKDFTESSSGLIAFAFTIDIIAAVASSSAGSTSRDSVVDR